MVIRLSNVATLTHLLCHAISALSFTSISSLHHSSFFSHPLYILQALFYIPAVGEQYNHNLVQIVGVDLMLINGMEPTSKVLAEQICKYVRKLLLL